MRALSPALTAAIATPGSVPDLKLELADIWPHFATIGTWASSGPTASAIAPDGSVVSAYVSTSVPQTIYVRRVSDPANAAQWGAWTAISTDGRAQAGVALCVAGSTMRVLWQSSTTTAIKYADSTNSGASWTAPAALFDPAAPCYGLAADGDLSQVLVAYDALGLGSVRLAVWKLSGTWSHTDWTNGDQNTIVGIAASRNGDGSYGVAIALQGATGEAYSIQTCVYSGGWTPLSLVAPVDTNVGLTVHYPHLSQFDGGYRLAWQVADSGAVSGLAYTRSARTQSVDFVHWQAPLEDQASLPSGAAWLKHASCYLLIAPETVRRAPLFDPTTGYRDLTADIVRLDLVEREGEPAKLVVTLDNSTGTYTSLAALKPNAQLLLSQGFVGAGLLPTHLLYLDEWTYVRAADLNEVTLVAQDRTRFLERQTRVPLSYANRGVAYILADLAALAGFDAPASIDGSSQFSQTLALFQVHAGQTYRQAMQRLLAVYDGTYRAGTAPGSGTAFAALDTLAVIGKSAGQPSVWTAPGPPSGSGAPGEPEHLHLTHAGERANHLVVYGPRTVPTAVSEAWDFADAGTVGQERYALVVDSFAASAGAAALIAALALAREGRLATRATLTIGAHPGLELGDAITVGDSALPATNCRIVTLSHSYHALESLHELVLGCEGL